MWEAADDSTSDADDRISDTAAWGVVSLSGATSELTPRRDAAGAMTGESGDGGSSTERLGCTLFCVLVRSRLICEQSPATPSIHMQVWRREGEGE